MLHVPPSRSTAVLILLLALAAAGPASSAAPAPAGTDTVLVRGVAAAVGTETRSLDPGADLRRNLLGSPFALIRRGNAAVSDLYADGFKKGDLTVTIDGERFTTACPNRMDTRVGQVNLLDVEIVELDRTGGSLQAGLGGRISYVRRRPGREPGLRGRLTGAFDRAEELDLAVSAEGRGHRASVRHRRFAPWQDGDGGTFEERYGYTGTRTTDITEIQAVGTWDGGDVVATFERSRDVLFPYLKMDERENDHYQVSAAHRGHRLYFNRNEHLMDNRLRSSLATTDMRTDATNTMFGAVGGFYEVWARNWKADNVIIPAANPALAIANTMLPDVWRLHAAARWARGDTTGLRVAARLGLSHTKVHDTSQADRYAHHYPDAETDRLGVPFGATVGLGHEPRPGWHVGWSAEVASDDPGIEALYISVDKPGTNPTWLGNPGLANPVRATLRAKVQHRGLRCEVFGTRVWEYAYMVRRRDIGGQGLQTYEGIGALLAGTNLAWDGRRFALAAAWNWGEKTATDAPLAEIQPLLLTAAVRSPAVGPATGRLLYEHAAGQGRVDADLDETATGAWDRVDLGVDVAAGAWIFSADLENVLDASYARHLSYLRSPFASGVQVREPGRTVRVTALFAY